MGLLSKETLAQDVLLGFWWITEDFDQLISKVTLTPEELATLNSFKNQHRKLEWLSVRCLINAMAGNGSRILYTPQRKPYLFNREETISISHSRNLTAILMANKKKIGIDLEFMSHKIKNIASRFINPAEYITTQPELESYHLYIHWCAKEALYKLCDKENINFRESIVIKPFEPTDKGTISATVTNYKNSQDFTLCYSKFNNYVIVWCIQ